MRRPPSLALLPSYPVTGGIGLMAAAVTAMTETGKWSLAPFTMGPTAFGTQPWRLVTSALPHVGVLHLVFNLYWLWVFGTLLEEVLGHLRLFGIVALFAAASAAAEYAVFYGGVGLSGVGYGLFGMLWMLASRDARFAGAVDRRTVEAFVAWFFVCIAATWTKVMVIANVAHAVGALLGILVGLAMSATVARRRALAATAGVATTLAAFVCATVARPLVNLSDDAHASFQLGYDAIQEGRFDEAVKRFHEAIALRPTDAKAWHNLGVAYNSLGQLEPALDSMRLAYAYEPTLERRGALVAAAFRVADAAEHRSDHAREAVALVEIVTTAPDQRDAWAWLARSYHELGIADGERDAWERYQLLGKGTAPE